MGDFGVASGVLVMTKWTMVWSVQVSSVTWLYLTLYVKMGSSVCPVMCVGLVTS